MSLDAVGILVQAFISCRLDYCNSLFYGISDGLMTRLQSVQNAAARLVSCARRCNHILPVLRTTSCTGFRFGSGWTLRSPAWSTARCLARRSRTWPRTVSSFLMRFDVSCVRPTQWRVSPDGRTASSVTDVLLLWNILPVQLRQTDNGYKQFKRLLMIILFGREIFWMFLLPYWLTDLLTYSLTLSFPLHETRHLRQIVHCSLLHRLWRI